MGYIAIHISYLDLMVNFIDIVESKFTNHASVLIWIILTLSQNMNLLDSKKK